MQSLRVLPDLRSSVVEDRHPGQVLLYTSERDDSDASLTGGPSVRPFSWRALLTALRDPELELLEVAEPLWYGEWCRALRYVALAKLVRPRVAVATYAIDNLDARVALGSRARRTAVGLSLRSLDLIAFGTTGAAANYRSAFGRDLRRTTQAVLTPRLDECRVCGGPGDAAPRDPVVLFLGTPSARKGFPVLLEAWERSGAAHLGWRLLVADPAGQDHGDLPAGVATASPSRDEVHTLLRRSAVVAMPSVRTARWREQIGLPLVEGLAHGCRVVTTTETGLADDLRDHPLVTLTAPGDPDDLAAGLRRAMDHDGPATAGRAGHTKSDVVDRWLAAARIVRESPHRIRRRTRK